MKEHRKFMNKDQSQIANSLVSIAVATYNGEQFLRQQLDSIYNQTYPRIEVVVSDDCSTDKTIKILEEYQSRYGLIYSSNDFNLGLIKNFEKVISLCSGDYIALSDQDDVWKPKKIETLLREIGEYSLIYSPTTEVIDFEGNPIEDVGDFTLAVMGRYQSHLVCKFGTGKPTKNLIAYNWVVSHQVMFKKNLTEVALPIPNSIPFHDAWLAICASKLNGIKFLNTSLMQYRLHSSSYTYIKKEKNSTSFVIPNLSDFSKKSKQKKLESGRGIEVMKDIASLSLLDDEDRKFAQGLERYFRNICDTKIHWYAFRFAIKYLDLFCWYRGGIVARFRFLLGSLIA